MAKKIILDFSGALDFTKTPPPPDNSWESKFINVGFWPELPYAYISPDERRLLPEKVAVMEADNDKARARLKQALAEAHDPSWKRDHPDEYAIVLAYLNTPERTDRYRGSSPCRVCGCRNGSQDWYKGPFRYPQGYVHYLVEHDFKPPQQVIDAALGDR